MHFFERVPPLSASCGSLIGSDLREDCVKECEHIAKRLKLDDKAFFAAGDMRVVKQTVDRFRSSRLDRDGTIRFGGMFTSIPFWNLETVSCTTRLVPATVGDDL